MAALTAHKVKLYRETFNFIERFNRDTTWKISLLNAVKKGGKKNHLGTPLIGYAWIIFKSSPQFATSHGFKLLDSLNHGRFDEFANTLDDLFSRFWLSTKDRENLDMETRKYEQEEIERPDFISEEDHQKLAQIENQQEGPAKQAAFETFTQSNLEQLQTPHVPTLTNEVPIPTPGVSTEGSPEVHPGGEKISEKTPAFITAGHEKIASLPSAPLNDVIERGAKQSLPQPRIPFQFRSPLQFLKSLKLPTNISIPVKKFISRNLTPMRIASAITGGIGSVVGYGITNTPLGAITGGGFGLSIPSLVKSRGAGQMVLTGVTKAGNAGGSFLSGISSGGAGGGIRGGSFLGRAAGGTGKKAAIIALLGFVLLSAFLVGFSPPGTPGGGTPTPGSGTLTPIPGGSCPDQASIDANKKDPNTCKYFGLGVNLFDTNISQAAIDLYINKYSSIFINAGKGDSGQFQTRVTYIVTKSKEVGLNPVLFLGYWKTESNFSTVGSRDLGCSTDAINFYEQVDCALGINDFSNPRKNPIANCARSKDETSVACNALKDVRKTLDLTNPIKYPIRTFDDFAEAHGSRDPNLDCTPEGCKINNNCKSTYNKLVEVAKELNACIVSTPTVGSSGQIATCPLSQNGSGSFNITCGTFKSPGSNKCGHADGGYPLVCNPTLYACNPDGQYRDQLKAAIDVRPSGSNGDNSPVYFPFINGSQSANWTLVSGPTTLNGGAWGVKLEYETTFGGKRYRLDLTHLDPNIISSAIKSGDQVGTTKACVDRRSDGTCEGGHLHTAISVDGVWKDSINESYLCSNSTPLVSAPSTERFVVGKTVNGRDIEGFKLGSGNIRIALIAGMHGNTEPGSTQVINAARADFQTNPSSIPNNITLYFIPLVNVDPGSTGRWNAHEVDINRNFDSSSVPGGAWNSEGCSKNSYRGLPGSIQRYCGDNNNTSSTYSFFCDNPERGNEPFYCAPNRTGSTAFSEPESQAIRDFIISNGIKAVLSYHAPFNSISTSNAEASEKTSGNDTLANQIATNLGIRYYPFWPEYPVTGQFMDWLEDVSVIGVEIELSNNNPDVSRNITAIKNAVKWISENVK